MTTSSSTDFDLNVAEYIEEAYERCGLEAKTGYDLQTARRSMNIMLAEWANRGLNQWTIEQRTQALTASDSEYSLIFVQRLSKLQESANKLKKLGYYDNYYNKYNVEDIYKQRENYYRRLKWQ